MLVFVNSFVSPVGVHLCRADEFICNNTLCKLHIWVCDGADDCGDNSDEDAEMCGAYKCVCLRERMCVCVCVCEIGRASCRERV